MFVSPFCGGKRWLISLGYIAEGDELHSYCYTSTLLVIMQKVLKLITCGFCFTGVCKIASHHCLRKLIRNHQGVRIWNKSVTKGFSFRSSLLNVNQSLLCLHSLVCNHFHGDPFMNTEVSLNMTHKEGNMISLVKIQKCGKWRRLCERCMKHSEWNRGRKRYK